ncbi:hypothetical protein ACHAWF_017443 [Thalassiosira exigua]
MAKKFEVRKLGRAGVFRRYRVFCGIELPVDDFASECCPRIVWVWDAVAPKASVFVLDSWACIQGFSTFAFSSCRRVLSQLDPSETALVLVEYQNEFTTKGGKLHDAVAPCMESNNMLKNSLGVLSELRSKGCHIFHVPIMFKPGHREIGGKSAGILSGIKEGETFTAGTFGAEFHKDFQPEETDIVVNGKLGLCGFFSTNLDFLLRQKGVKNVILGGFLTNCCIESTMRTAYECGYSVYTLKDCTAATSVEAHSAAFEHSFGMFSTITDSEEVKAAVTVSA